MTSYKSFGYIEIKDHDLDELYDNGYVLTRKKCIASKIISLRVRLRNYSPTSENRRILRKFNNKIEEISLPLNNYDWKIGKIARDFYAIKHKEESFSTNIIKQLLTDPTNFLFNTLLNYENHGYCICLKTDKLLHYAYPFYVEELWETSFGMYMMTKCIEEYHKTEIDYIYLGSVHNKKAFYKLQFRGLEWFDPIKNKWKEDLDELKSLVISLEQHSDM
ncbi:MAG: hypothetical protein N3A71_02180 [Candidatus Dojkabacteria bacterium]|nr:hypothetical protein [Candidatus Dojkabacteria bacterium]